MLIQVEPPIGGTSSFPSSMHSLEQVKNQVSHIRQHLGSIAGTHAASIFAQGRVTCPEELILNGPMTTHQFQELLCIGLGAGETGNAINDFPARLPLHGAAMFQPEHLPYG